MNFNELLGNLKTTALAALVTGLTPIASLADDMDMKLQVYPGYLVSLPE